jgi:hypothetical protein
VDLSLRYLLLNQLLSLKEHGYDVTAISSAGPDVPVIEEAGITHFAVPFTRRFTPIADLVTLMRLVKILRREQFTLVHTHTPKAGLLGQLAARMAGVPVVINTVHGFYFHSGMRRWTQRFYTTMERIAARCSDAARTSARSVLDEVLRCSHAARGSVSCRVWQTASLRQSSRRRPP